MKWHEVFLGDLVTIKHGWAFKGEYFSDSGEYLLLTPGNCHPEGGLKLKGDKEKYYAGEFPEAYLLKQDDMIVVMTDLVNTAPILGGSFLIPEDNKYLHNQRLGLVQVKDAQLIDRRFLYHVLNTHEYRSQVRGSASGATVKHTAPERIYRCSVRIPVDTKVQRRIADTLFSYDDLIDNNRKRIALLEQSARELYKEWFVRLRFPGFEHTKIISGVPEGWEKKTLGKLCTEIRDIVSPENADPTTPYIGLEHLPRRSITLDEWGYVSDVTSSKHRFVSGDILFGKIRPYFHKVGIALVEGVASSDAIVIRAQEDLRGLVLLIVSSDSFVADTAQRMKEGSKMPRADWKQMQQYPVLVPNEPVLKSLRGFVEPLVAQLRILTFQCRHLREARDILLPKLMSGEIEV